MEFMPHWVFDHRVYILALNTLRFGIKRFATSKYTAPNEKSAVDAAGKKCLIIYIIFIRDSLAIYFKNVEN